MKIKDTGGLRGFRFLFEKLNNLAHMSFRISQFFNCIGTILSYYYNHFFNTDDTVIQHYFNLFNPNSFYID